MLYKGGSEMKIMIYKLLAVLLVLCLWVTLLSACDRKKMLAYYTEKENYVSATGIVSHIKYSEDHSTLYLAFDDLSYPFDDNCFKVVGDNLQIIQENGIDSKCTLGQEVTFISAPRYFGDGYVMPIVAIYIDEECLLDFEVGYANLLDWLN